MVCKTSITGGLLILVVSNTGLSVLHIFYQSQSNVFMKFGQKQGKPQTNLATLDLILKLISLPATNTCNDITIKLPSSK